MIGLDKLSKIPIAEGSLKGNLKFYTQEYHINYLPTDVSNGEVLDPKLELAILVTKGEGHLDKEYQSLRFTNSAQVYSFIMGMCKGYFMFAKKHGDITPANYQYQLNKMFKEIQNAIR